MHPSKLFHYRILTLFKVVKIVTLSLSLSLSLFFSVQFSLTALKGQFTECCIWPPLEEKRVYSVNYVWSDRQCTSTIILYVWQSIFKDFCCRKDYQQDCVFCCRQFGSLYIHLITLSKFGKSFSKVERNAKCAPYEYRHSTTDENKHLQLLHCAHKVSLSKRLQLE